MSSGFSCVKAALALFTFVALALAPRVSRAADPYVHWYTVKSPHFRVHYHAGLERVAQKAVNVGEDIYARLVPVLGFTPDEVTELVLTDEANDSNGFANTLPYARVTLFPASITGSDERSIRPLIPAWILGSMRRGPFDASPRTGPQRRQKKTPGAARHRALSGLFRQLEPTGSASGGSPWIGGVAVFGE